MSLFCRRCIFILFVFFFLISASGILLYSTGYRYNFKKHTIEQLGAFVFETDPADVEILIDNQISAKNTKRYLKKLLPDTYSVEIRKEGYYSWYKKLAIKPNLTTFIQNVKLFKKSNPKLIIPGNIAFLTYFEDSPMGVGMIGDKIVLIHLDGQPLEELLDILPSQTVEELYMDAKSERILFIIQTEK
ncbi:MAG: hypothetical protein HY602_03375, partial [Parcubacteria group bacterium]|nr:hypothetical protein [Parcubacteria group bacterium]